MINNLFEIYLTMIAYGAYDSVNTEQKFLSFCKIHNSIMADVNKKIKFKRIDIFMKQINTYSLRKYSRE